MLKITDNIKLGKLVGSSGSSGGSSGSSNYEDLENKPSINGITLNGNKTSAELGVLDLNTSEAQIIKSPLLVETGFLIFYNNTPIGGFMRNTDGSVDFGVVDIATKFNFIGKNLNIAYTPTITNPTTLADLPDNALLTKAQVQEMINNALNNS